MRLVSKKISDKIYQCFDKGMSYEDLYEKRNYMGIDMSIFDHYLTIEEAEIELPAEGNEKNEKHLCRFFEDIYKSGYQVYQYIKGIDELAKESILEFRDYEEYMDHVIVAVKEYYSLTIIIPELKVIISGISNYGPQVFFKEDSDMEGFKKIAERNGLHFWS